MDLGGNIYVIGDKIVWRPRKVGVQNPEKSDSNTIGFVSISNKSIVTSGYTKDILNMKVKIITIF